VRQHARPMLVSPAVSGNVPENRLEPRSQVRPHREQFEAAKGAEIRILNKVVRVRAVTCKAEREFAQVAEMVHGLLLEGRPITFAGLGEFGHVIISTPRKHLSIVQRKFSG
jgi:hypothetical protein